MRNLFAAIGLSLLAAAPAAAQVGPARARPINGATKPLPMMLIDQRNRLVVLEVDVDAQGRVTATRIEHRSDNSIFDERMRGYWKATPFMPALDADGRPVNDTLRITNTYSVKDSGSLTLRTMRNHSDIDGDEPAADAARIERMRCADLLWEYDFMKRRAPKARLEHEKIFQVPFAMFLAAGNVSERGRDALIAEWPKLVQRTLSTCREKPDAAYWKEVFVRVFERATPYESPPVP
jgi:TonB family protein